VQPASLPDPDRVVAARDAVLSSSEFQYGPGWLERLLVPKIQALFDFLGPWKDLVWPTFRIVALVLVVAGLIALFVALIRAIMGGAAPRARPGVEKRQVRRAGPPARARLELARVHFSRHQFDQAVREAWLATITVLDPLLLVRARAERADYEYVQGARDVGAPVDAVRTLASHFQRVRYGARPASSADASACLSMASSVHGWSEHRA
jgi:hypothetical protein